MSATIHPYERVDDLQFCGLKIIQNPNSFRFGMDAVLLADFAAARPGDRIGDFGAGTGILSLLLSGRAPRAVFNALEIQADMADMAQRSVRLNGLEDRITVTCADLRSAPKLLGYGKLDLVVCNPPYSREGEAIPNPDQGLRLARHESGCTLEEIMASAGSVLKTKGRLAVVFPAARLLELMDAMRKFRVEPKRLRLVYPKADRPPNIVLLEGIKEARPMLSVLAPLIVYQEDGSPTMELKRIYHQE